MPSCNLQMCTEEATQVVFYPGFMRTRCKTRQCTAGGYRHEHVCLTDGQRLTQHPQPGGKHVLPKVYA